MLAVCNPLPTVVALTEIAGTTATVTLMLSDCRLAACASSWVVHGSVACPPYVRVAVPLTRPVAIVTGDVAATQFGSAAVSVTVIPGAGAAAGTPLLSKLNVMEVPKLALRLAEPWTMLIEAVVVAAVTPST